MICKRTAVERNGEFQTREVDGKKYIEGYFSVFGAEYWLWDDSYETVDPGAFDLAADTDVRALTNHDTTLVLGRTTAGTLTLKVDDYGLWGSILINDADQDALNTYERVKRGDVNQCSFGFDILTEQRETLANGFTVWHLQKVKLYEVTIATFPAYPQTAVEARKAELADVEKRKLEKWRADTLTRLKGGSKN